MSCHVDVQLVKKIKIYNFSKQLDESTVRDSETLLMAYVRYVDNGEFIEDMLFCEALETTTLAIDICIYIYLYKKLKTYLDDRQISMENIISCVADGALVMMGNNFY